MTHGFSVEYWSTDLRPHPVTCSCAPDGYHCEQAQAVAEEAAERREMAGAYLARNRSELGGCCRG